MVNAKPKVAAILLLSKPGIDPPRGRKSLRSKAAALRSSTGMSQVLLGALGFPFTAW